ncbi:MAG: hypothetical protein COW35_08390, partial [Candidatus Infernicultor aquiphilus]
MLKVVATWSG